VLLYAQVTSVTSTLMNIRVVEYIRADRSNPYQRWFERLDRQAAAKVAMARARLELGHTSAITWFGGIGEYRINWGPGYRIYLAQDGAKVIVLFGGGTKQRQQADIEQARALHEEYKARKKAKPHKPVTGEIKGNKES
jgi:putative addiction module killer protein